MSKDSEHREIHGCKVCNMDAQCQSNLQSRDNRIVGMLGVGNSSSFRATSLPQVTETSEHAESKMDGK
ncbi:hypothetical protein MA16_Dca029043 [Dendrobium catenatum]|uniref:Uncharacterized protein n=1 Tax=Dendrobium catenatum TaxID=906689 RepID=A0A2I0VCY2_9ASPA|nr:hypothetical protein MA16_Dca029043 [Dendrobium catenatum]